MLYDTTAALIVEAAIADGIAVDEIVPTLSVINTDHEVDD